MQTNSAEVAFWNAFAYAGSGLEEIANSMLHVAEIVDRTDKMIANVKTQDLDKSYFNSINVSEDVIFKHLDQCIQDAISDGILNSAEVSDICAACEPACELLEAGVKLDKLFRIITLNPTGPVKSNLVAEELKLHFEEIATQKGLKPLLVEQRRVIKHFAEAAETIGNLGDILGDNRNNVMRAFISADAVATRPWNEGSLTTNFYNLKDFTASCSILANQLRELCSRSSDVSERIYDRLYKSLDGQSVGSLYSAVTLLTQLLGAATELVEVELQQQKQFKDEEIRRQRQAAAEAQRLKEKSEYRLHVACVIARLVTFAVLFGGYANGAYLAYNVLFWTNVWNTICALVFWGGSALLLLYGCLFLFEEGENPLDGFSYSYSRSLLESATVMFLALSYYYAWYAYAFT